MQLAKGGLYLCFAKLCWQFYKAVKVSPELIEAHYNLAIAYRNLGNIPEMISAYRKVVDIGAPEDEIVDSAKNNMDIFEEHILKGSGIDLESYLKAYRRFDNGVKQMENRNWVDAIDFFQKALEISPNHT